MTPKNIKAMGIGILNLEIDALQALNSKQIKSITSENIALLDDKSLVSLLPRQVKALEVEQLAELGSKISFISEKAIGQLNKSQLEVISIESLSEAQIKGISISQWKSMSVAQFGNLSGLQKNNLSESILDMFGYCKNHCDTQGVTVCKDKD
jgi:hypothetical protein